MFVEGVEVMDELGQQTGSLELGPLEKRER